MEFKEFTNPEETDYDIMISLEGNTNSDGDDNPYVEEQMNLIGLLEDVNETKVLATYGITAEKYFHPTKESITRLKSTLGVTSETPKSK